MRYRTICLFVLGVSSLAAPFSNGRSALAQGETPSQLAPAPGSETTIPEKIAPPGEAIAGPSSGESLSDHLNETGGVLAPQGNPDPGISVSPPVADPGTTIVIPPPGSPGGDPTVQPQ